MRRNTWRVLFLALALAAGSVGSPAAATARTVEIKMNARRYQYEPAEITVHQGDHVKLIITALDRDHGFKLGAFHIKQRLKKGVPTTIEFTADRAGTFPFRCSVICGRGHLHMKGKLVVEAAKEKAAP